MHLLQLYFLSLLCVSRKYLLPSGPVAFQSNEIIWCQELAADRQRDKWRHHLTFSQLRMSLAAQVSETMRTEGTWEKGNPLMSFVYILEDSDKCLWQYKTKIMACWTPRPLVSRDDRKVLRAASHSHVSGRWKSYAWDFKAETVTRVHSQLGQCLGNSTRGTERATDIAPSTASWGQMTEGLQDPGTVPPWEPGAQTLGTDSKELHWALPPQLLIKMPGILAFLASHFQICTAKMHNLPPNVNDIDFYFSPTFSDNVCWCFKMARELTQAACL